MKVLLDSHRNPNDLVGSPVPVLTPAELPALPMIEVASLLLQRLKLTQTQVNPPDANPLVASHKNIKFIQYVADIRDSIPSSEKVKQSGGVESRSTFSLFADLPETDLVGILNSEECSEIICTQACYSECHNLFWHFEQAEETSLPLASRRGRQHDVFRRWR